MRARRLPNKDCTPNNAAQKVQTPDKDAPKCKGSQRTNEATTQLQGRRIRGGSRGCMGVEPGTRGGQGRGRQPGQALEADDEQATLQGKGLSTPKEI